MRCVLPHIPNYGDFLCNLFNIFPKALVYIEYQGLEKIINESRWYMFMHDHCNYFTQQSFKSWECLDAGEFNEWNWVLLAASHHDEISLTNVRNIESGDNSHYNYVKKCNEIMKLSDKTMRVVSELTIKGDLCIYSAAGKAANFGFAASQSNLFDQIYAVDLSKFKIGKYLEGSGIKIYDPRDLEKERYDEDTVIMLNKMHFASVKNMGFTNILMYDEIIDILC